MVKIHRDQTNASVRRQCGRISDGKIRIGRCSKIRISDLKIQITILIRISVIKTVAIIFDNPFLVKKYYDYLIVKSVKRVNHLTPYIAFRKVSQMVIYFKKKRLLRKKKSYCRIVCVLLSHLHNILHTDPVSCYLTHEKKKQQHFGFRNLNSKSGFIRFLGKSDLCHITRTHTRVQSSTFFTRDPLLLLHIFARPIFAICQP